MEDIKYIVAKNIAELRLLNNMTQMELAEKLNYSDKTVSKWERAESSPDISVLVEIAALFGVTLDYLVTAEHAEKPAPDERIEAERRIEKAKYNRRAIAYISESVGWLVAVLAFIITTLIMGRMSFQWLYFVYALPVTLIVKLVFNSIWFNTRHNYPIISALMWSLLLAVHTTFLFFGMNASLVYLLGVVGQFVIILWSFINRPKRDK